MRRKTTNNVIPMARRSALVPPMKPLMPIFANTYGTTTLAVTKESDLTNEDLEAISCVVGNVTISEELAQVMRDDDKMPGDDD